jgi:hypothetical protein
MVSAGGCAMRRHLRASECTDGGSRAVCRYEYIIGHDVEARSDSELFQISRSYAGHHTNRAILGERMALEFDCAR